MPKIMFTIVPIISIAIFVLVFIVIIISFVRTSKMSSAIFKKAIDEMNEDPYERAEKMAVINAKAKAAYDKEVNPEMKALKCPNCGASVKADQDKCEYCNAYLTKGTKKDI